MNQTAAQLLERIENCSARVGVVGMGYVGHTIRRGRLEAVMPVLDTGIHALGGGAARGWPGPVARP